MSIKNNDEIVLGVVNNWYRNLDIEDEDPSLEFEYSRNKFKQKFFEKTKEELKITKRLEAILLNKIANSLAKKYSFSEQLMDKYIDWCFDNYDHLIKKYGSFSLNCIAAFAEEWTDDLFSFDFDKPSYLDLSHVKVSDSVFYCCEKYGIPFASTKLQEEIKIDKNKVAASMINKLDELKKTKDGLSKIKNMLRKTVENGPYSSRFLFADYEQTLKGYFKYFAGEPWCNI
jgi:hypothetical protein